MTRIQKETAKATASGSASSATMSLADILQHLPDVEIKGTATTSLAEITREDLNAWGVLFDQLQPPFRTPAFKLLQRVRHELRRIDAAKHDNGRPAHPTPETTG